MNFSRSLLPLVALTSGVFVFGSANAANIYIAEAGSGYIAQYGANNGSSAQNSLLVGNCGTGCGLGEVRNFFTFDIPILSDPLTSALLVFAPNGVNLQQYEGAHYIVTSTASHAFADLGTGLQWGQYNFFSDVTNFGFGIFLPLSALEQIGSGGITIETSGRIASPTLFDAAAPNELAFTGVSEVGLIISTQDVIPEPNAWVLMLFGFGGVGAVLRSRPVRLALV